MKEKILKFRNYQPYDNSLASKATVPESSKTLIEEVNTHYTKVDVIKQELENFKDNEELNIAPKKINWVRVFLLKTAIISPYLVDRKWNSTHLRIYFVLFCIAYFTLILAFRKHIYKYSAIF